MFIAMLCFLSILFTTYTLMTFWTLACPIRRLDLLLTYADEGVRRH